MIKAETISKSDLQHESLQFEQLMELGIMYAEEVSGAIWTDYNEHDPGVTMLEYLCYGITDLAYRTDFPITDLLYSKNGKKTSVDNAFFPAHQILTTAPLTIQDYRKLIIDRIQGVQNVWLSPIQNHIQKYKGLYQVYLQINEEDGFSTDAIKEKTWELLQANRNLCEDFEEVHILKAANIELEVDIHLSASAIAEDVLASILYEIDHFLNPNVNLHNPDDLKRQGWKVDELYDGPLMEHGIIKNSDLTNLRKEIYINALKEIIQNIEGVRRVQDLIVRKNGMRIYEEVIHLEDQTYPHLIVPFFEQTDRTPSYRFHKGGFPVPINPFQTQQILHSLISKEKKGYQLRYMQSIIPSHQKFNLKENLFDYISIQQFFPHIYGINSFGLPVGSSPMRRNQAKQLKGYLVFFEVLLSSYLSQLANVRHLFDINKVLEKSYFVQFPKEIPDVDPLIHVDDEHRHKKEYAQWILEQLTQELDPGSRRLQQFMDHLLARFGVQFPEEVQQLLALETQEEEEVQALLLEAKQKILRQMIAFSKNRAQAFNYTKEAWETENVSCLKKRVCTELNIDNYQNRNLAQTKATNQLKWHRTTREAASTTQFHLREMLSAGLDRHHYEIVEEEGIFKLLYKASYNEDPLIIATLDDKAACEKRLDELIAQFQQMNQTSKGCFVMEHLLLRPSRMPLWNLRIGSDPQDPFLESLDKNNLEHQTFIGDDLLVTATKRSNYSILKGEKQYFILLKKSNYPILVSQEKYANEQAAEQAILKAIHELTNIMETDPLAIDQWIYLERETIEGLSIENDFYSSRLSVIFPNWNELAQNEDFKRIVEHRFSQHAPAHLAINFHWLSFSKMKQFEALFKQWLQEKSSRNGVSEQLDQLSLQLIELLKGKNNSVPNEPVQKQNSFSETALQAIFEDISLSELYNQEDLSLIVGIELELERLLNDNGIQNWEDLAKSSNHQLQTILQKNEVDPAQFQVALWIEQAQLGVQSRWQALASLQKQLKSE